MFYTSIRTRVKDQESLMKNLVLRRNRVWFVNQARNSYLPGLCKSAGVEYQSIRKPLLGYSLFRTMYYAVDLIFRLWINRIDVLFSHLEPANFIAVLIQYFVPTRIVIVRHHQDLARLVGFDDDLSYKVTYNCAREIITVSKQCIEFMVKEEGIERSKITHINLGYDFSLFGSVDESKVSRLHSSTNDAIRLVTIGRLDKFKRPELSIKTAHLLKERGFKVHLWLLGDGESKEALMEMSVQLGLQDAVEFVGYSDDVLSYIYASDWVLHPSVSEASCVVLKEAGLVRRPIIACRGVGDFDNIIESGTNGILVDRDKFSALAADLVAKNHNNDYRKELGDSLYSTVMKLFKIEQVLPFYERFGI